MEKKKLIRLTTVPISLEKLLENQLRFMKNHYDVTMVSSDKDYLEKVGKLQDCPVYHVEMTRKITPIQDLKSVWELYRFLKKEKPFIVHSHTPKAGIVGMLAAKLAGVPHRLHTVAGLPLLEATGNKRKLLDFVEKMTYSCATKVYPNSKGLRDIILDNEYAEASKIKVIGTAVQMASTRHIFQHRIIRNSKTKNSNLNWVLPIPISFLYSSEDWSRTKASTN